MGHFKVRREVKAGRSVRRILPLLVRRPGAGAAHATTMRGTWQRVDREAWEQRPESGVAWAGKAALRGEPADRMLISTDEEGKTEAKEAERATAVAASGMRLAAAASRCEGADAGLTPGVRALFPRGADNERR
ncbi:hypothetical protein HPB48_007455 [Haemaphysalis longicornis]|uniref:Uncharacterized protein n=1 Tax=Haemaphysalis longicornis TaxID=44386 RepID=A0A9J6GG37_HAELO|nr:hypothetical protein HPB48_007455 [Haemaphysalis longicornis]